MPPPAALNSSSSDGLLAAARAELRLGKPGDACVRIDLILDIDPDSAEALHLKGLIEAHRQAWRAAAVAFRLALKAMPANTDWARDLGAVLAAQGDWPAAADAFSQVLIRSPDDHIALAGYGRAMVELNCASEAIPCLQKALGMRESAAVLLSLARAFAAQGHFAQAIELLSRTIALEPACVEPHRALGLISLQCGNLVVAGRCWESVLRLTPGNMEAETALIRIRWGLGDLRFTVDTIERKIREGSASEQLHAFWLYVKIYEYRQRRASRRRMCEEFARRIRPPQIRRFKPCQRSSPPDTKLRIGYLSGEFIGGPPFYFLSSLLGNHDWQQCDVFFYHTRDKYDDATAWYSRLANWRDCRELDDDAIRNQIDRDGIQILVDLSGFFPDNRLRIFAGRAAPVQAAYPNCPTTTGLAEIDYIFTDRWTCGHGQESQYTERPVYLPSGYLAYTPPADSPATTALPASRNGFVTFGIFQRRAKMHAAFWDLVAEVIRECDRSRLLVQNCDPTLDDRESENYCQLIAELANRGISEERVSVRGARPHDRVLATMAEVDIALDTFPYQGQTTTCECLWQGVPVIALSGETHASRVGSALLQRAGLTRFVAKSQSDYIRKAVSIAGDPGVLARLRAGMRNRLLGSTLLDGHLLAWNVERMYRRMWQAWRRGTRDVG